MQNTNLPDHMVGEENGSPAGREEGATGSVSDLGNESLQNLLALEQMKGDVDHGYGSGGSATTPGAAAQNGGGAGGAEGSGGSAAMPPAAPEGPLDPRENEAGRPGGSAGTPPPRPPGESGGAAANTLTDDISPISIASSPMALDDGMGEARPCAETSVMTVNSSMRSGGSAAAPRPVMAERPMEMAEAGAASSGAAGGSDAPPAAREANVSMISISSEYSPATNDRSRSVFVKRGPQVYDMARDDEDGDAVMKGGPAPMPHFQPGVAPLSTLSTWVPLFTTRAA